MRRGRVALYGALLFVFLGFAPSAQSQSYMTAADIARERVAIARQLVQPIARCVQRHDTSHAAFHGCIDWHSAVHGTLGLIIFGRITGDTRYDALVDTQLAESKLALERALLRGNPRFEMPYGRAWFLRLAVEYERRSGSSRLRAMADEVAESLRAFLSGQRSDLFEGAYDSVSWALINMIEYAQATGNQALLEFADSYAREALSRTGPDCDYGREDSEFMSICVQRTWLASLVLPQAEFKIWNERFLAGTGLPTPVGRATSAHHHGLNFSRAWGLAALHRKTGHTEYGAAFVAHFAAGYLTRANWDGAYEVVAHWVAQFAMLAVLLNADPPAQ